MATVLILHLGPHFFYGKHNDKSKLPLHTVLAAFTSGLSKEKIHDIKNYYIECLRQWAAEKQKAHVQIRVGRRFQDTTYYLLHSDSENDSNNDLYDFQKFVSQNMKFRFSDIWKGKRLVQIVNSKTKQSQRALYVDLKDREDLIPVVKTTVMLNDADVVQE